MSTTPRWRKSSRSGVNQNTDCVEVAALPQMIGVRDSKAPGAGHLALALEHFAHLVARVKRGELDG
ncbi:DUF397 domain-containing protein [Spirillospora sp. NBC_01491]|uniref:DUF397 domain-containing protein n=1 Tax=Spirillospora sp. NBC_01491 TaxID=2976007 RepID=UPI002E36C362|nr:DUF397 domain-containing protein [Spirillospora sp. NBC_01491]